MSSLNRRLLFVAVGLVVLVGAMIWFLSTDRPAQREPLSIVHADSRAESPVATSSLEDPGDKRVAPAPGPSPVPAPAVGDSPRSQSLPQVVSFLRAALPDRYGKLTAEDAEAITSLDLRGASITDADLARLAALPNLATICLHGTAVTDAGMAYLRNIPKLTSIDLRSTKVTGAGVLMLPTERIEALHLTDTQVKGEDLRMLPPMPKLQVFKLNRLNVDDAALASLPSMPSLSHVELDGTKISDNGLRRLVESNPRIRRFELRDTPVTEEAIKELSRLHPDIEFVHETPEMRMR